jgi:hypothetical protein
VALAASTWSDLRATFTLNSSFNNLAIIVWSSDALAQNATLDLSAMQIERGATATPFEVRPIAAELALCQRYFERLVSRSSTGETLAFGGARNTASAYFLLQWQEKRTPPTLAFSATTTWTVVIDAAAVTTTCTDIFGADIGVQSCRCVYLDTTNTPFTAGTVGRLRVDTVSANDATVDVDGEI